MRSMPTDGTNEVCTHWKETW